MSKQTSTALNINDLFGDDNANPESGDKASQDSITRSSDSASASAARPSRPAAAAAAGNLEYKPLTRYSTIWATLGSGGWTYFPGSDVYIGGKVYLACPAGTTVTTDPPAAFGGTTPYSSGGPYYLQPGISGPVKLTPSSGTTGTINVGGGSTPCPPNDNDDDSGDRHHRGPH